MLKFLTNIFVYFFISNSILFAQTWTQIPSGTTTNLTAISFPSISIGYIGGEDSLLLKTTDGGQTWAPINFSGINFFPSGHSIVDLKFVSETVGYLTVGPYSGTYKTTDGGLTWTAFDPIYACFNTNMYFFNENIGFLGGSGCFSGEIINKLDTTWSETNVTPTYILQGGQITNFDFWNTNLGIASSSGNYFFKTTDGGNNWDTIPNSLTSMDSMTNVLFYNADTILATYKSSSLGTFGVLISFDAGATWQDEMTSATFFYPDMFAAEKAGNGHIYIGGENSYTTGGIDPGLIYESYGAISNWTYETVAEGIRDMDSYSDSVVFGVGQNGYIVVNQNLSTLALSSQTSTENFKIYPNPTLGDFTINFGGAKADKIEILDTFGRQVYETYEINYPELKISRGELNPGFYNLKIMNGGQFTLHPIVIL